MSPEDTEVLNEARNPTLSLTPLSKSIAQLLPNSEI